MSWLDRIEKDSPRERKTLIPAVIIAVVMVVIDQWTKWFFINNYELGETSPLIPGILNFTYVRNLGAAWSILSGKVWLLLLFGIAAGAAISYYFSTLAEGCVEMY